jgi:sortase A
MWRRPVAVLGRVLVIVGVIAAGFVAFEYTATDVLQHHSQAAGLAALVPELRRAHVTIPSAPPSGPPRVAATATAPPVGAAVGVLSIPSISVRQVIFEGVGEFQLSEGPGHYPGTSLPGERGNAAIAGHRTTWGHPFRHLDQLVANDPIVLTTPQGTFVYRVRSEWVVSPSDTAVLARTTLPVLTLTTCNPPYSAATRLVIRAALVSSSVGAPRARAGSGSATPADPYAGARPVDGSSTPSSWAWFWLFAAVVIACIAGAEVFAWRRGKLLLPYAVVIAPLLVGVVGCYVVGSRLLPPSI